MKSLIALIALLVFSQASAADTEEEASYEELLSAKTIRVTWGPGVQTAWKKGKPKTELIKRFSDDPVMNTITYDSIDLRKGTARAVAKEGAEDVHVMVTLVGLSFIQTVGGGQILTTIYSTKNAEAGGFHAVTSRHLSLQNFGGADIPSQYYGTAVVIERN